MFSACPEITSTRHEANVIVDDLKTFDSPAKADAILRSKNSKGFGVLKGLLFLASLVFGTTFSSWEGQGGDNSDVEIAINPVEEDSTTLSKLPLIYPTVEHRLPPLMSVSK